MNLRKHILNVIFWSIISAAFIGPGTVTTAAKAGSSVKLALLWTLVFSIFGTIVLQEASARLTISSQKNLGALIRQKYSSIRANWIKYLLFGAIGVGCLAYQAGNMLGAIAGLELFLNIPRLFSASFLLLICGAILWQGESKFIARFLGDNSCYNGDYVYCCCL